MNLENSLLKYVIQDDDLSYPEHLFSGIRLDLYRLFKKYHSKYEKLPNKDTLKKFVDDDENLSEDILVCYININASKDYDKEYLKEELYKAYLVRKFDSEAKKFANQINSGKDVKEGYNKLISNLIITEDNDEVKKGYIWESAKERYTEYKLREEDDGEKKRLNFHIKCFNKNITAFEPDATYCYVGMPGCGKTTICLNIAYNLARFSHRHVMFVSGELKKRQLETNLDARDSLVDSLLIRNGSLSKTLKEKFLESLKEQRRRKDNLYIIEAPPEFTINNIYSWISQYKRDYGRYPDDLVIDYLWLMELEEKYNGLAEKLGGLAFSLRHKIAKKFNIHTHYSTQESRGGQLKKADGKERSMESIGESNKIAPHVHTIFMLDTFNNSNDYELRNKIRITNVKNTLGSTFKEDLWYLKEFSYIGDSTLGMIKVPEKKEVEKKEKKEKKQEVVEETNKEFQFEDI